MGSALTLATDPTLAQIVEDVAAALECDTTKFTDNIDTPDTDSTEGTCDESARS